MEREEPFRSGEVDVAGADPLQTRATSSGDQLCGVPGVRGGDRQWTQGRQDLDGDGSAEATHLVDETLRDQQGQRLQGYPDGRPRRPGQRTRCPGGQDVDDRRAQVDGLGDPSVQRDRPIDEISVQVFDRRQDAGYRGAAQDAVDDVPGGDQHVSVR